MGDAAMHEAMMKAMTPGEEHKKLAQHGGDWTFTNKMWMAPGQPPMESGGTMHADVLLGGRYVEAIWKGSMMGMPFEGHGRRATTTSPRSTSAPGWTTWGPASCTRREPVTPTTEMRVEGID